jgi:hypothetical protein
VNEALRQEACSGKEASKGPAWWVGVETGEWVAELRASQTRHIDFSLLLRKRFLIAGRATKSPGGKRRTRSPAWQYLAHAPTRPGE